MRIFSTILFAFALLTSATAQSPKSLQDLRNEKSTVLQFEAIPNASDIEELKKMGVELINYLGDNTYEVAVTKTKAISSAGQLYSTHERQMEKSFSGILQDIQADFIPEHAKHNDNTVDIAVTFKEPLSEIAVAEFIQSNKASLVNNISDGQVIVINIATDKVEDVIQEPFIRNVEFEEDEIEALNFENKAIQGVHYVYRNSVPGMELDGSGVVIGVGDGGKLGDHIDFENKILFETSDHLQHFGEHADHVSGTMISNGNLDPRQTGFAPNAGLVVERTSNIIYAASDFYDNFGMVLTNNSYGSQFDCETNGSYNYTSFTLDKQLRDMPSLMHVFAAGNNGVATCDGYPKGYKTVLKYYGSAKNVLTVGSVDRGLNLADNSSKGPAKDGRIKPEICGVGVNVLSNGGNNDYKTLSGTSMAAPSVTGSMALMYQKYEQDNGEVARGDLMKAIICNSADDLGVSGPDYRYGFGLVNTYRAISTIEEERYLLGKVENNQKSNHIINVPQGVKEAKFLLYWNDKEITAGADKTLVNNLDVEIIAPDGEVILPWVLNHNSTNVDDPARRGVDLLNNIEQITIQNPQVGDYTLVIKGTEVPFGPQEFVATYELTEEEIILNYPAGNESLVANEKYTISWMADRSNQNTFKLELSLDGGATWSIIVDQIPAENRTYEWRAPSLLSQGAKVRVSVNGTNMSDSNDMDFNILGQPTNVRTLAVCNETIRLLWDEDGTADEYVVYMLKDGNMEVVGQTSQKYFDVEYAFEDNKDYWFSVANKMSMGKIGERTVAITSTSNRSVACDRENDGKLINLFGLINGRAHTMDSLGDDKEFSVLIQNNGSNDLSNYDVAIRVNESGVLSEKYNGVLESGKEVEYAFNNTFDLSQVGTYTLDAWMSHPLDKLHYNDSLVGQFVVHQLPNEPVEFPLAFDFQEVEEFYYHEKQIGLGSLTHFDFYKEDNISESYLKTMGSSSYLVMENHEAAAPNQDENGHIITLNMTSVDMSKDVTMSFDANVYSQDLGVGATVWLRGSDRDEWFELQSLGNDREWVTIEDLNITEALKANYQVMSTSTQIKFALPSEGAISIDNIVFDLTNEEEIANVEASTFTNVYPNIVFNDINLEIENQNFESAKVSIVSSNGQIVHQIEENLDLGTNIFNYNETENLQPGMYFLTIEMGSHTEVKKFSKITD